MPVALSYRCGSTCGERAQSCSYALLVPVTTTGTPQATPPTPETPRASTESWRPRIALVGPRTDSRGGVATTLRLLQSSRLADEFHLVAVPTYRDGTGAAKALEAAHGLLRLVALCAGRRVDLVHVHTSSGASLVRKSLSIAVACSAGVPVVLHVHGGGFGLERKKKTPLGRLQDRTIRWALERSDAVVALTPSWERSLAARGRLRRSCVIANAPDLEVLSGRASTGRRCLVVFLGHLYRDKGVYDLIEAFAIVGPPRPGLRLVLAGEGPEAQGLRLHASRLGLDSTVELPGWVGSVAKADLLANAACFVLPSHYEGLPLAMLEAMVSGVPVVATSVGGVPDVVGDGRDALLVPPNDVGALATALTRVLDDPKLAARLSGAARARALAEYTSGALAERIGNLYRDVLASR